MTRIQPDAEEWIAEMPVYDGLQLTAGHADADGFVPFDDGAEIWRDQFIDIIPHTIRQVARIMRQPAAARVEGAPDAVSQKDRIARLQAAQRGAGQAEAGALATGEHQMAGLRLAGHLHQGDRFKLAHARFDAEDQIADSLGCECRGELETGELIDIVDGAQSSCRVHENFGRIPQAVAPAGQVRKRFDDEGGDLQRALGLA